MQIHSRQSLEEIHGLLAPPHTTRDPLFPSLKRVWLRLLEGVAARRRERKALAELAALDDRMLADIGLTRADVPRWARAIAPFYVHR